MLFYTDFRRLLFIIPFIISVSGFGSDLYDLSNRYFCSTCFTNNQDQNYHCCFYFFKCCAEARRGSRSTTPGPNYPVIPTRIAYIVQGKTNQPCSKNNCPLAPPMISWETQNTEEVESTTTENYFQPAEEFEDYVEADSMVKNSSEDDENVDLLESIWTTSEKYPDTEKPFHFALGANMNPSNMNSKFFDANRKLFIPPSLATGHESFDLNLNKETGIKKAGWVTKELLKISGDK